MKRIYSKPVIAFQKLEMSANLSAGCELISTNNAVDVCPVVDEETGWSIFADYSVCDQIGNSGTVCYDVPLENYNVFHS